MTYPLSDEEAPNSVERDPRPIVRLSRPGLSGAAIALGAAILDKAASMGIGQTLVYA